MQKLGRISPVDLREIWTSEDMHFTPWLAQPENLELLGEALGIDLQVRRSPAGEFAHKYLRKRKASQKQRCASWVRPAGRETVETQRHLVVR